MQSGQSYFFYLKQYTEKVNPFQSTLLVLLEGKHTELQSCVIKPSETETGLYPKVHNLCNVPCSTILNQRTESLKQNAVVACRFFSQLTKLRYDTLHDIFCLELHLPFTFNSPQLQLQNIKAMSQRL